MTLSDLSLKHRLTVFFLAAVVLVTGLLAYVQLPRESSPDVSVPVIIATTPYPGASPLDVESQITRPLERELQGIDGLKSLTAVSLEGAAVLTLEFVSGTEIESALQKTRDRVKVAEVDFPEEAEETQLQEINFSDIPILQINLSGNLGPVALKRLAEDLQDRVVAIPGALRASIVGGQEREVRVEVDPQRLQHYSLSLDDVLDAVRDENVSIPGGQLDLGDLSYAVRVPGEVDDPRQIEDFVIQTRNGSPIQIRDVATVTFGFEDRASYARIDGKESVALSVQKRVGANIIEVADAVHAIVAEEQERWPRGVTVTFLGDQSLEIRRMVRDLENNILSGLCLVVLVLMFALGLRNALFVGLAIPFSMLLTFSALELSGTTLNIVVLFSLVLAVGMLVDNAVVVVENIYRHMQEGATAEGAAGAATREVGSAILVSTLTTVGAFFPLIFWPGVVGDFMSYLPLTVSAVLLASLLIAFTLNPAICASFMKVPAVSEARRPSPLETLGETFSKIYRAALQASLRHRGAVLLATVVTFAVVAALYAGPLNTGIEFIPNTEPNQIFINIETPSGTRLDRTDALLQGYEEVLEDLGNLKVRAAGSGAGSQSDPLGLSGSSGSDPTHGRISLDLVERHDRTESSFETLAEVRRRSPQRPGVRVDIDHPTEGPPVGDPLSIEITGEDFDALGAIAGRIRRLVEDIPGLVSLSDDFDLARPEVRLQIDRVEAARLGLTTAKIARTVRTAINGTKASVYRWDDDEADIVVRLEARERTSLEALGRLPIFNEEGQAIPLNTVAKLERSAAITSITRKNQKRVVTVSGKVTSPTLAAPIRQEARRRIEAQEGLLPPGYRLVFAGQSEDEQETQAFLARAFLYSLLIVLAMMVAKFDSLALPAIIMSAVAMSMIGVLSALIFTGLPFGILMTGLGVISLAGIVVNNAIVLLDYGEQQYRLGVPRDELVLTTGLRRMRPVLLTTVTTILGLIPLATGFEFDFHSFSFAAGGESSQWWRGMAVAVIFGLAFATFLTLIVVPVLYDLLLELRERRTSRAQESGPLT